MHRGHINRSRGPSDILYRSQCGLSKTCCRSSNPPCSGCWDWAPNQSTQWCASSCSCVWHREFWCLGVGSDDCSAFSHYQFMGLCYCCSTHWPHLTTGLSNIHLTMLTGRVVCTQHLQSRVTFHSTQETGYIFLRGRPTLLMCLASVLLL